jgi:hypothetical protein
MHAKRVSAAFLTLLSISVSTAFLWIGVEMSRETDAPFAIWGFGWFTILYALLQLSLLVRAWRFGSIGLERIAGAAALVFFVALMISAAGDGNLTNAEQAATALAAVMLFVNWLAVKRAVGTAGL